MAALVYRRKWPCAEAWLGVDRGGEARLWLAEQSAYDVWQAEQKMRRWGDWPKKRFGEF